MTKTKEERRHFSILVGSGEDDAKTFDVMCRECELEAIALSHYYWEKEIRRRPLACLARKGGGVSFRDCDFVFADCM